MKDRVTLEIKEGDKVTFSVSIAREAIDSVVQWVLSKKKSKKLTNCIDNEKTKG